MNMILEPVSRGWVLCLAMIAGSVSAAGTGEKTDARRWSPDAYEKPWQEGDAVIPEPPRESNFAQLQGADLDPDYEVFIDKGSLSLLADKVFRYTAVVQAPSGPRNVFYEGIRCGSKEFKIYAFLSGDRFRRRRDPQWEQIYDSGATAYREVLIKDFVCQDSGSPADLETITARLEKGDRDARRGLKLRKREPATDQRY